MASTKPEPRAAGASGRLPGHPIRGPGRADAETGTGSPAASLPVPPPRVAAVRISAAVTATSRFSRPKMAAACGAFRRPTPPSRGRHRPDLPGGWMGGPGRRTTPPQRRRNPPPGARRPSHRRRQQRPAQRSPPRRRGRTRRPAPPQQRSSRQRPRPAPGREARRRRQPPPAGTLADDDYGGAARHSFTILYVEDAEGEKKVRLKVDPVLVTVSAGTVTPR